MPGYDRPAIAKIRFENAKRCLHSSNILLENGDYKSAVNRSYYAMFYAMRAVLALEGKDFKKHSAVISYFRKEYIKMGIFDPAFSKIISELFEVRTDSDYDDMPMPSFLGIGYHNERLLKSNKWRAEKPGESGNICRF